MDENTKEEKATEPINVNVEIDYDKLATAIVKVQEKAKANEDEKFTKGTFSFLTSWVLQTIGGWAFLITLFSSVYVI